MVKKLRYTNALAVLLTVAGLSAPALAGSEDVVVENAWSRASIGVNRPGAAYMTVRNTGEDAVTLTGLATPLAMMPEIHESKPTPMASVPWRLQARSRLSPAKAWHWSRAGCTPCS